VAGEKKGFLCPSCGGVSYVTDSRQTSSGVRRRRRCEAGHRFTTNERIDVGNAPVIAEDDLRDVRVVLNRALRRALVSNAS
jgi:transcriptional regulator NrdR family protein